MVEGPEGWSSNWSWGLPIIVLTVLAHGFGLVLIHELAVERLGSRLSARRSSIAFAATLAVAVLMVTVLHGLEATVWAAAYIGLGALPDARQAMLFSLNAMTTYGHDGLALGPHWMLMGALEALNGVILFGLTTAFLFAVLQNVWPRRARDDRDRRV